MYSPTFVQKVGDDGLKTQAVGCGPFTLVEFKPNEIIRMKKNPDYWQKGKPYFDEVVVKIVGDPNTRATMLASGDADLAMNLSSPTSRSSARPRASRSWKGPAHSSTTSP